MIVQATDQIAQSETHHLVYITLPASKFKNDPIAVRQPVYDFLCCYHKSMRTQMHPFAKQWIRASLRMILRVRRRSSSYQQKINIQSLPTLFRN